MISGTVIAVVISLIVFLTAMAVLVLALCFKQKRMGSHPATAPVYEVVSPPQTPSHVELTECSHSAPVYEVVSLPQTPSHVELTECSHPAPVYEVVSLPQTPSHEVKENSAPVYEVVSLPQTPSHMELRKVEENIHNIILKDNNAYEKTCVDLQVDEGAEYCCAQNIVLKDNDAYNMTVHKGTEV